MPLNFEKRENRQEWDNSIAHSNPGSWNLKDFAELIYVKCKCTRVESVILARKMLNSMVKYFRKNKKIRFHKFCTILVAKTRTGDKPSIVYQKWCDKTVPRRPTKIATRFNKEFFDDIGHS